MIALSSQLATHKNRKLGIKSLVILNKALNQVIVEKFCQGRLCWASKAFWSWTGLYQVSYCGEFLSKEDYAWKFHEREKRSSFRRGGKLM